MKKLISLGLGLVFALSLAACGADDNMGGAVGDGMSSIASGVESAADKVESGMQSAGDKVMSGIESAGDAMQGTTSGTAKITADEAKAKALEHAGLKESDVQSIEVDLDRDGGVLRYEVDFHSGDIEYDYDINAETGDIISADRDRD